MGGRRKGGGNVADAVRAAFSRALTTLAANGKPLHDLIRQELLANPMNALTVLSRYIPKELMIEASITDEVNDMTDKGLSTEIGALIKRLSVAEHGNLDAERKSLDS